MTANRTVSLFIDGITVKAGAGTTVLEAARNEGIHIPTLCYHRALGPYGVCRLCIVEAEGPGLDRTVTTSCNLKISEGLVVETATPLIAGMRKGIIELLLSGTATTGPLKELAAASGVVRKKFRTEKPDKCILCGLCVRVCKQSMGVSALSFEVSGGNKNRVVEYISLSKDACIGCGACAQVCPVGAIRLEDRGKKRRIKVYGKTANTLALLPCKACGTPYAASKHIDLIDTKLDGQMKNLCPKCAKEHYAAALTGRFPPDKDRMSQ